MRFADWMEWMPALAPLAWRLVLDRVIFPIKNPFCDC